MTIKYEFGPTGKEWFDIANDDKLELPPWHFMKSEGYRNRMWSKALDKMAGRMRDEQEKEKRCSRDG